MISAKSVFTISFRWSGTHMVLETIKTNFDFPVVNDVAHPGFDLHTSSILRQCFHVIYVYRDPRNVMKSLYNYFKYSDWRLWSGFDADLTDVTFSDFLRGKTKIVNVFCPNFTLMLENPVRAWVEHTNWLVPLNKHDVKGSVFSVKFEDMVREPENEIQRISKYLCVGLKNDKPKPLIKMVSQNPINDDVDYTDDDMDFLIGIAGDRMMELGYKF